MGKSIETEGDGSNKGMIILYNVRDNIIFSTIIEVHLENLHSNPNLNHQFDNILGEIFIPHRALRPLFAVTFVR